MPKGHHIAISRRRVLKQLLDEAADAGLERDKLADFASLLAAIFHFELHAQLEELKARYEPWDPESADHGENPCPPAEDLAQFATVLEEVLRGGNYRRLNSDEIALALRTRSLVPVDVAVDLKAFSQLLVYARGEQELPHEVVRLFGLSKKTIQVASYERICLFMHFDSAAAEPSKKARKKHEPTPRGAILKLFRNIPKADLEVLFPNCRLKMRAIDKLLLGVPAVVGGIPVAIKLAPAVIALAVLLGLERGQVNVTSVIAGLTGLVGLGLFLFKQWDKFKSRKLMFMKLLSDSLYFKNLDNNQGVLTRLIDEAEEEETKEALLGYFFLLLQPGQTDRELDRKIELWFSSRFNLTLDFEVEDALGKLRRLGLATSHEGRYRAVPPSEALEILDARWDAFFPFNTPTGEHQGLDAKAEASRRESRLERA